MNRTGIKRTGRCVSLLLAFVLVCMSCIQMDVLAAAKKKPKPEPQPHTAAFRIISTTDLHGQVSTTHYDTASEKPGSLAQAYTLIKQARQEVGTRNTMTVDTGDSIYGYAADYILDKSGEETIQPIYKAMSLVNYDAICLGNHDFDYGYSYIDKQLELSGLKNKCIVSNIIKADTGETAWNESKMISKQLKTSKNKSVNVEVGVIGITIPSMSSYSNCKEDLIALPIVSSVEKQAAYLDRFFLDQIYPVLTPMAVDSSRPFPLIRNKSLNLAALLLKKKQNELEFATVQVPSVLPRIVVMPEEDKGKTTVILLEEIIERNIQKLFSNYEVICCHPYRVMRNADLTIDEDGAEDLLKEMEKQLK